MPALTKRILKYSDIKVVFATASPRRRELSKKIKYVKKCPSETLGGLCRIVPVFMPVDADEVTLDTAEHTAIANARLKGEKAARLTDLPVLAFDTVVGIDGMVLGKPKTREKAISMLKSLCGNTHEVVTAVYMRVKSKIIEKSEKTWITFGAFDKDLVYNYVDSGAPYDKAGGYNIDDEAIKPLAIEVNGDRDNVVGLPVRLTEKLIEENLIYGEDGYCD